MDRVAREDIVTEQDQGLDLRFGKIAIAELVAGIGDLDADRARVDVGLARPEGFAGVPGALAFVDQPERAPVLEDEIVRRDGGARIAQPAKRLLGRVHAGVVQDEHVDALPDSTRTMVRRREFLDIEGGNATSGESRAT